MSARSAVLGLVSLSDTLVHVVFTCPADTTCLVKTILLGNSSAATTKVTVAAQHSGVINVNVFSADVTSLGEAMWQGWVVLEPGDLMYATTAAAPCSVVVYGSVLDGVAPPTTLREAVAAAGTLPQQLLNTPPQAPVAPPL